MKLKLPIIFSLLFLLSLKGFSENPEGLDLWSTPVSFELEAVALLNLPDTKLYVSNLSTQHQFSTALNKVVLNLAAVEAYDSPECPTEG